MKRFLLIIGFLLLAQNAFAAVARSDNGNGTTNVITSVVASSPLDLTTFTPSGSNACMIAFAMSSVNGDTQTVTWDPSGANQALTRETGTLTDSSGFHSSFWVLIAPTLGNKTLRFAWTGGAANVVLTVINFSGADQATCTKAADDFLAYPGGTAADVGPISSATGDATVAVSQPSSLGATYTTNNFTEFVNTALSLSTVGSFTIAGTSNTHSFTADSGQAFFVDAGIHILAAAGGGGATIVQRRNLNSPRTGTRTAQ